MKNFINKTKAKALNFAVKTMTALSNKRGENYVDSGVKILIAVVLGALLLSGLYALFGDVIMPTLEEKITEMFNYAG